MNPLFFLVKIFYFLFKILLYIFMIVIPGYIILLTIVNLYPVIFPYDSLKNDQFRPFISSTNRIVIFILGLTVSANIYLYTTRNKISSSIMWSSKQIEVLTVTIIVNLFILFLGNFLVDYEFIFAKPLPFEYIKAGLFIYYVITLISIGLFIFTLYNFVTGFKVDQNVSKALRKINRKIYPVDIIRVYDEVLQIVIYARNNFERYLQRKQLNESTIFPFFNKSEEHKWTFYFNFLIKFIAIFFMFLYYFLKIVITRRNNFIVRTYSYSDKEIEKINLEIEILCQNLEYVIRQNSNKSLNQHFTNWNATFSQLIVMAFHIRTTNNEIEGISKLYKDILNHHSRLIIATSKNYEHKTVNNQLMISLFKGLAYKEEAYFDLTEEVFESRTSKLEEVYFDELFNLFITLIKEKEFEFFNFLQTDGLSINSFMNTNRENEKYFGDKSRKERYEQLFISIFIKMIELNITDNLSTVMAILLSLREENVEHPSNLNVPLLSNKKQKIAAKNTGDSLPTFNLSHRNKVGLYYAAIKANELENYKAAGYITKVLSSNLEYSSLSKVMIKINSISKTQKNAFYSTGIYKVDFNNYSFKYCVDKTFVLMNSQYFLKQDFQLSNDLNRIFSETNIPYFIEKIETKQKEYNMIALSKDNLNRFKESLIDELNVSYSN